MQSSNSDKSNIFSNESKAKMSVGQEINQQGLVWRKLSNGSGVWRYDFRSNGRRYKGSIGKDQDGVTLSAARKKIQQIKAHATLESCSVGGVKNSPALKLFHEVAEEYLEWAELNLNGIRQIKEKFNGYLIPYFTDVQLQKISTIEAENFKTHLITKGLSNSTIKKLISHLSQVFEYARKADVSILNPTRGISKFRAEDKDIKVLVDSDLESLLATAKGSTRNHAIVGLASLAGLRASEILGLKWSHVDLGLQEIKVCQRVVEGEFKETTKNRKHRIIPIGKKLLSILESHRDFGKKSEFVISNKNGGHMHHIQKIFDQIKKRVTFDYDGGIHVLRHTFATNAIKKGVDLPTVQLWMGHSDVKTTMRYVHICSSHSAEKMKMLD